MERLKSYWDELHTEFRFLSDKNLRDVVSHIVVNKFVIDMEYDNATSITSEMDIVNNEIVDEVNCHVTTNDQPTNEATVSHVTPWSTT